MNLKNKTKSLLSFYSDIDTLKVESWYHITDRIINGHDYVDFHREKLSILSMDNLGNK